VPGVHDVDLELAQPLHRAHVRAHVRLGQRVDELALVDRAAREQRPLPVFEQADAAGRVPRLVDHAEGSAAEVDRVPAVDEVGRVGRDDAERRRAEARMRQRVDQ